MIGQGAYVTVFLKPDHTGGQKKLSGKLANEVYSGSGAVMLNRAGNELYVIPAESIQYVETARPR